MSTSFNLSLFFSLLPVFYVSPLIPDSASVHASIAMVLFSICVTAWSRGSDTEINSSCLIPSPPPPPLPLLHCLIFMRERKWPPTVLPYALLSVHLTRAGDTSPQPQRERVSERERKRERERNRMRDVLQLSL